MASPSTAPSPRGLGRAPAGGILWMCLCGRMRTPKTAKRLSFFFGLTCKKQSATGDPKKGAAVCLNKLWLPSMIVGKRAVPIL